MPRCPFAEWKEISGPSGPYLGGPFKIVHHTTEGGSAQGAFDAFRAHRSDPHFTVDSSKIYQHIDTGEASRALRNPPGGVETNRDSAVQIEVVGFAHLPKSPATLRNVQRLCNWLEATHHIPKTWPNGPPKPAVNGRDPGGHNRSAANWDQKGGHYGHSQVPENTHWDPGYTAAESAFVIADAGNESVGLESLESMGLEDADLESAVSLMPDHADPQGLGEAATESVAPAAAIRRPRKTPAPRKAAAAAANKPSSAKKSVTKKSGKKSAKKAPKKAAKKSAKKTVKKSAKKSAAKTAKKTARKAPAKSAKAGPKKAGKRKGAKSRTAAGKKAKSASGKRSASGKKAAKRRTR